jgi:phage gpG-like protein
MSFGDMDSFITHMKTRPAAMRKAQRIALQTVASEIKEEAKYSLGTYQDGWPELKDITKELRAKAGHTPNDPLLVTGALRDSIHYRTTPTSATIGSDSPYAGAQENGNPKKNLPPRPFLGPAGRRHTRNFVNTVGTYVAYALASQSPPATGHHEVDFDDK